MKVEADKVGPTLRQRLLDGLSEGQLALGPDTLAVDVVDGQLRSKPIVAETDEGRATGTVNLDVRTFAFDSEWRVERKRLNDRIDEKAALPAAIIQYRGPVTALSALDARINTDALERELTARKMELDLEELERLRQADEARRRSELERQRQQQPQDPWAADPPGYAQHARPAQRHVASHARLRLQTRLATEPGAARAVQRARIHTRTALDRPLAPRDVSMRAISCETGTPSSPAACLRASQNGASSEMEVRCPAMVKERLTGLIVAPRGSLPRRQAQPSPSPRGRRACDGSSVLAFGAAFLAPHAVEPMRIQGALRGVLGALALGDAEQSALLVRATLTLGPLLVLAVAVQVDNAAHHASGPIIFLGSTILSNSSADTYPPPTASSLKVVPFLCAVLAILAALS